LPNAVVDNDSVDLFKSRLDHFWMSQDVKYLTSESHLGWPSRAAYLGGLGLIRTRPSP